ncbi:hypothetical protein GH714_031375 [Hevea brasiliensis]|uniref:TF-B3 domain-containing protein n=1 Tax=Hevea brasiliensis TaxID=3981 RepID=A0A6A6LI57_HEVBR|nr:hypothetical protein GH714_031344 [Hevea brasiliensis]KAF2299296.1 hypothetical protein GH714_031375 [Hevea brasiliensis]
MAPAFWTRISKADMRIPNALIRNVPEYYLANFYLVMPTCELWDVIIFQGLGESLIRSGLQDFFNFYNVEISFKISLEYIYPNLLKVNIYNKVEMRLHIQHLPKHEALRVFGGESKSITLWRNHLSMSFKVEYTVRESKNGSMNLVSLMTKITVGWFKFVKFCGIEKGDLITFQKIDHKGIKFFVLEKRKGMELL